MKKISQNHHLMNCKSCGNELQETFCPICGEKKFDTHQLSVKHFAEETFEGFIHFDNKFLHTLKLLLTKPGQLSLDYTEGRRIKNMKPVQFFLVVNLLFFFLIIGNNLYSLGLNNYITYQPFTSFETVKAVNDKLAHTGLTLAEYKQLFNEEIIANSKEFIFIFVPFYGLIFGALLFWKKKFFVEHLIFATHFMAFILLLNFLGFYLVSVPFSLITKLHYSQLFDDLYGTSISVIVALYTFLAILKYYKSSSESRPKHIADITWSVIISLGIGYSYFTFIQGYRMLLFWKIIYFK